jgi:hypothetical protein
MGKYYWIINCEGVVQVASTTLPALHDHILINTLWFAMF